jgi:hypothetical protein
MSNMKAAVQIGLSIFMSSLCDANAARGQGLNLVYGYTQSLAGSAMPLPAALPLFASGLGAF